MKSRKVQVKICPTKVGKDHFWCRRTENDDILLSAMNLIHFSKPYNVLFSQFLVFEFFLTEIRVTFLRIAVKKRNL